MLANGDARSAYNTLEALVLGTEPARRRAATCCRRRAWKTCCRRNFCRTTNRGEEHFNLISALHKSVRNSDPDAALYWLARMLESGEDPLYIARRMVRMASEDIGLAEPNALAVTLAAKEAFDFIGPPEGNLALAQAAVYLSLAPKSNALYTGYGAVREDLQKTIAEPVPLHLRNAVTGLMKNVGYGKGYQYAHDAEEKVTDMTCLPESLLGGSYYKPTDQGFEARIRQTAGGDPADPEEAHRTKVKMPLKIRVPFLIALLAIGAACFSSALAAQDKPKFVIDQDCRVFAVAQDNKIVFVVQRLKRIKKVRCSGTTCGRLRRTEEAEDRGGREVHARAAAVEFSGGRDFLVAGQPAPRARHHDSKACCGRRVVANDRERHRAAR